MEQFRLVDEKEQIINAIGGKLKTINKSVNLPSFFANQMTSLYRFYCMLVLDYLVVYYTKTKLNCINALKTVSYLSYIYLGSSVCLSSCHIPVVLSSCHPVIFAER